MAAKWYPVLLGDERFPDSKFPFGVGHESMAAAECELEQIVDDLERLMPGDFPRDLWETKQLTDDEVKAMKENVINDTSQKN